MYFSSEIIRLWDRPPGPQIRVRNGIFFSYFPSADPEGGTGGPDPPPLENDKLYGFL